MVLALLMFCSPAQAASDAPWWESLSDPALASMVEQGLQNNPSVQSQQWLAEDARAQAQRARAALLPTLSADASWNYAPTDSLGFGLGIDTTALAGPPDPSQPVEEKPTLYGSGSVGLNAGWNLDVFGTNAHTWRAGVEDTRMREHDADAVALSTARAISDAYYDVVLAELQLAVVREQRDSNTLLLGLVEEQYAGGAVGSLDVLQQRQLMASAEASVPQYESILVPAQQRLSTLLGEAPDAPIGSVATGLPEIGPLEEVGLGAQPALASAEAASRSAAHRKSSAVGAMLPTLRITANAGVQGFDLGELDTQSIYGFGGSVSIPLFDGGLRVSSVRSAQRTQRARDLSVQSTRLDLEQRLASARFRDAKSAEQLSAARMQRDAAVAARDEAQSQYLAGLAGHAQLVNAITAAQSAELAALRTHRDRVGARLDLIQAAGGDWTRTLANGEIR